MTTTAIDTSRHPIGEPSYAARCQTELATTGALVLDNFFAGDAIDEVVKEFAGREAEAFYASSTHNVYLTPPDPHLADDHPFNRQITSTKGLLADDQISERSPLRYLYDDATFRAFLCQVLNIDEIHPYADDLSSINVHFADAGRELGWHFDNSSFAVTMLLQAPDGGGVFEYVADVRNVEAGDQAFERVESVLDGDVPIETLDFEPGSLVLFRGRDALHRVTPVEGGRTRMLVVFAFNDQPGVRLSASAVRTFYGREADE